MATRDSHSKRWGDNTRIEDKKLARTRLIQAAAECYLHKGLDHTSIHDITEHAKVSRSTFYQYFSGKDDLRQAVLEHYNARLFADMLEELRPYAEDLYRLLEEAVVFAAKYRCLPGTPGVDATADSELMRLIPVAIPEKWMAGWIGFFDAACRDRLPTNGREPRLRELAAFAGRLALIYRQLNDSEQSIRGHLRAFNDVVSS